MKKIYPYLVYAGAIPFVFCATYLALGIKELQPLGSIEKILSVYSIVIASFLAGAHWGQHLHIQGKWVGILPILSNAIVILLWFSYLLLDFKSLISVCVLFFAVFLFIDYRLFKNNFISPQYFYTRRLITVIVISTLIVSGISS